MAISSDTIFGLSKFVRSSVVTLSRLGSRNARGWSRNIGFLAVYF